MTNTDVTTLAVPLLIVGLVIAFIPAMPGPVIVWGIGAVVGALDNFQHMTVMAFIIATLLLVIGSTSDFWLPLFGIRTKGGSCQSTIGAFVGGMVGTFFIPIPILGTLIGCVCGALLVEFARLREFRQALAAGRHALKMYVLSYVVQVSASIAIFAVYLVTLQTAG